MKIILLLILGTLIFQFQAFNQYGTDKASILSSSYDQVEEVFNIELFNDDSQQKISGATEYGFGLWSKWMFTSPKFIAKKYSWHSLGRLTSNKNHQHDKQEGDRTLGVWIGNGFYQFATYTKDQPNVFEQINYKMNLDGCWNFLFFSYKQLDQNKGVAKGYIWFNSQQWQSVQLDVIHRPLNDYLHFLIKKEHNVQLFNGLISNVILRVGANSYIEQNLVEQLARGELNIPSELRELKDQNGKVLLDVQQPASYETQGIEPIQFESEGTGSTEYSVSGWVRWVETAKATPFNLVVRLSIHAPDQLKDQEKPGDRTLGIWKTVGSYSFATYTCIEEDNCKNNISNNINHSNNEEFVWAFVYFGYSRQQLKSFSYVKYASSQKQFAFERILHYTPTQFSVYLQKDPFYPGFNGFLKAFIVNFGQGSYLEQGFEKDKQNLIKFGYFLGVKNQKIYPGWKPDNYDEVVNIAYDSGTTSFEVELKEDETTQFVGVMEYSYGFWSRFLYNGPVKIQEKPNNLGISRLTTNQNYKSDSRAFGDRTLATWLCQGTYQFATYSTSDDVKNTNILQNVNYDDFLDGRWNYIYFGYKRLSQTSGLAQGYVVFDSGFVRGTRYEKTIIHFPLTDYIYFAVGSSGSQITQYKNFNGQISKVFLLLGDYSFINSELEVLELIKNETPKIPTFEPQNILVVDGPWNNDSENHDPVEYTENFSGVPEYSVETWFRWVFNQKQGPPEVIFTLSSNEPDKIQNNRQSGDRALSLFRRNDNVLLLNTYTTKNDQFFALQEECRLDTPSDQTSWVFAYFGYSWKEQSANYYIKFRHGECKGKISSNQRVPKYFGLYPGKDPFNAPFYGKLAFLYLNIGKSAWKDLDFQQSKSYIKGLDLFPTSFEWNSIAQKSIEFDHNIKDVLVEEFLDSDVQNMDGQNTYGYGFWSRYLTAYPTRVLDKPAWMSIARLTYNKEHTDSASYGDRVLCTFIGKGFYNFATYNANKNTNNQFVNINYGSSLEGVWNFIYISYSSVEQSVQAIVYFGDQKNFQKQTMTEIGHKQIPGYAKFRMGAEFSYPGFNGLIKGLFVRFDEGAYIKNVDSIKQLISQQNTIPLVPSPNPKSIIIEGDIQDTAQVKDLQYEQALFEDYSIYGWFKLNANVVNDISRKTSVLLKLTNNDEETRKNPQQIGDNTLQASLGNKEYLISTYTIGDLDVGANSNIREGISFGDELGVWTYIWVGYSRVQREVHSYVQLPNNKQVRILQQINHMVPGYLALLVGSDGLEAIFLGQYQNIGADFGLGAFHNCKVDRFQEELPRLMKVDSNSIHVWKSNANERLLSSPAEEESVKDIIFEENQISGATQYGWSVWTRWLVAYPTFLKQKEAWHNIVRMGSTKRWDNMSKYGNRLLVAQVGKGFYQFSTCDKEKDDTNVFQNVDYSEVLYYIFYFIYLREGHWNFLYFGYFKSDKVSQAKAFVHFTFHGKTKELTFNVKHIPLLDYLRVRLAPNEFSTMPFHGQKSDKIKQIFRQLYDLQVMIGEGFLTSDTDLKDHMLRNSNKPDVPVRFIKNQNVQVENSKYSGENELKPTSIEDQGFSSEYSVSGWLKFDRTEGPSIDRLVYRLTTNSPQVQRDMQNPGDRTLYLSLNGASYTFSTYDFPSNSQQLILTNVDLDRFNSDSGAISQTLPVDQQKFRGMWNFIYFGFNLSKQKAYALVSCNEANVQYTFTGIHHYIPKDFYFYLGSDGLQPSFIGYLYDWNLHFGKGSYTETPREFITILPKLIQVNIIQVDYQEKQIETKKPNEKDEKAVNTPEKKTRLSKNKHHLRKQKSNKTHQK